MAGLRISGKKVDITCTPEDCYLCSHLSQCRLVSLPCNDSCFIRRI